MGYNKIWALALPGGLLIPSTALTFDLLRPILFPFLWAVALSVPLHHVKYYLLTLIDGDDDDESDNNDDEEEGRDGVKGSTVDVLKRFWRYTGEVSFKDRIGSWNEVWVGEPTYLVASCLMKVGWLKAAIVSFTRLHMTQEHICAASE
jgi:hypothetical protein